MQKQRIVFVDDDTHFLDGIKRLFHSYRNLWEFVFFSHPMAVIDLIADDRDTVIVSDLMMPEMDGITLCNRVRSAGEKNEKSATYFILLSNARDTENKTLGLESGADDYVEKPFKHEELLARIKIGIRLLEAKAQLREAKEKAERHSAAKSEALANMSHEIRNPMNAILGMSSLLLETNLNDEAKEMAHTIHSASEGLLHLLNDVLDISKIEAGKFELDRYEFDMAQLIRGVVDVSRLAAQEKNTTIESHLPGSALGMLMGDEKRLRQVLINLISNAVKFTANGKVIVGTEIERDDASYLKMKLSVSDTGIGIPKEKQQKLFAVFSQADVSTQTRYGGTGLGLALSKKIVQMMGGELALSSVEGEGTKFSFSILLGKTNTRTTQAPAVSPYCPVANGDKITVLVADDNAVNRKVAAMMIKKLGVASDTAEDGNEVLEKMQHQYIDLVLMDVEMPNLDGLETTRIIRAGTLPLKNRRPRVISMTGHAMTQDKERFLKAGMDGVLTKPIRPEALKNELTKTMELKSVDGI